MPQRDKKKSKFSPRQIRFGIIFHGYSLKTAAGPQATVGSATRPFAILAGPFCAGQCHRCPNRPFNAGSSGELPI